MKRTLVFTALGLSLYATGPAMADSMLGDPSALATQHQWAVESGCSEPYLSSLDETCELASQDQSNSVAQLPQGQEKTGAQLPPVTGLSATPLQEQQILVRYNAPFRW